MAKLGKVVYLTEAQKETLFSEGTVTIDGTTVTYSANDLYLTPTDNKVNKSGDIMTGRLTGPNFRSVGSIMPYFSFSAADTDTNDAGSILFNIASGNMMFMQRGSEGYRETYYLPTNESNNANEDKEFNIITSKGGNIYGNVYLAGAVLSSNNLVIYHDSTPFCIFRQTGSTTNLGGMYEHIASRRVILRQVSTGGFNEDYQLPENDATANKTYSIVTTKPLPNNITIEGAYALDIKKAGDSFPIVEYMSNNGTSQGLIRSRRSGTGETGTYYENYYLPQPDAGRTGNATYHILTDKSTGKIQAVSPSSSVSLTAGTAATLCSITFEAGTYIYVGACQFNAGTAGYRKLWFASSNTGDTMDRMSYVEMQSSSTTTENANLQVVKIETFSSSTTRYLRAKSSAAIATYPGITAIRIL